MPQFIDPTAPDIVAQTTETLTLIQRFNAAFNRHDAAGMVALMTADCVFESTFPPPDGARFEGAEAVRAYFEDLFRQGPHASLEVEETLACGPRCLVRWIYRWAERPQTGPGHVRGVDVFNVRDGLIAEKLSYVKG
jgi:ketosteroid isomerase-like protein